MSWWAPTVLQLPRRIVKCQSRCSPSARPSSVTNEAEHIGPEGHPFAVSERIYCCWDFDHRALTLQYLDGIDPDYFATIASLLAQQLEADDALASSVALRVLYHQGLETLMSLLGAAAQAPTVVPAWIAKCRTDDLQDVVGGLRRGSSLLTQAGTQQISFDDLSHHLHRFAWADEKGHDSTAARFGRFWRRLSHEFLDETARAEYNALKHGTRVLPGGFTMAIGVEDVPGVAAPPERMRSIGGSKFGSTFFAAKESGPRRGTSEPGGPRSTGCPNRSPSASSWCLCRSRTS